MRLRHWNWGGSWSVLLVTACAGPTENHAETVTHAAAALGAAAPTQASSAATGSRRARSHQDPNALAHPTGRRELDAKDRIRAAEGAQKVIGVKPTQLLVDRLREEQALQGKRANAETWSALGSAVVPFGDDLITAEPTSSERIAAPSTLSALPRAVDNSVLPAFPEIRNQGTINSCVAFAVGYYQYTYSLGRLAGWDNKNADDTSKVSPKWLYNLVNGGSDSGTSPYWVHSIFKRARRAHLE